LGTISAFAYRHRETKKNLCRDVEALRRGASPSKESNQVYANIFRDPGNGRSCVARYRMHNSRIIIIRVKKTKLSLSSHEGT
jgi:hypothetical protein